MKDFIKTVNGWPLIVRLIFCIPAINVFYGVCRVINGINHKDTLWIILGVLTVFPGAFFMWVVDLIWILVKGHALMLGDEMFA